LPSRNAVGQTQLENLSIPQPPSDVNHHLGVDLDWQSLSAANRYRSLERGCGLVDDQQIYIAVWPMIPALGFQDNTFLRRDRLDNTSHDFRQHFRL